MGWASGGEIFDRVAAGLIAAEADDVTKIAVLGPLIDSLCDGDWDTLDESLYEFKDDPVIVELFKGRGVVLEPEPGDIGEVKDTFLWIEVRGCEQINVTEDLVEIAKAEGLTFEEVLEEAKSSPYDFFDGYISDVYMEKEARVY
jgi:hypothetical protein